MAKIERKRADGGIDLGEMDSGLVPGPVEYAILTPDSLNPEDRPILLWLHGGGGSRSFLESCRPQFVECWADKSLPAMLVATPSAGWSYYLDRHDGAERWESFLLNEFIPHVRAQTGSTSGPIYIGGISVGALGALRMAFKYPQLFDGVVALQPTLEAALRWDRVPERDKVLLPTSLRRRLFGQPLDHSFWKVNHPTAIAVANSTAIAAQDLAIYIECGDDDRTNAQYGAELLHRCLFDVGITHEYRLTQGANHVGPSVGPRVAAGLRYLGRTLWKTYNPDVAIDDMVAVSNFETRIRRLEENSGYRSTARIAGPDCELTVHVQGEGKPVVMLPSLGRSATDFAALAGELADAGFQALAVEPRGLHGSSSALADITLEDLADDVAQVIRRLADEPASILGHDFGGHVARTVASRYPSLVRNNILLATPGPELPRPEPAIAHRRVFVPELTMEEHLEAVSVAFFAEGNDPVAWVDGWHPLLATAQMEAQQRTPTPVWASGGTADTLIVRPARDRLVSSESTRLLANELGGKVSIVEIPGAGHALLPEQPRAVAVTVLTWLRRQG